MLRFEYDEVVAYHGYRLDEPWRVSGAQKIMQVDGINGPNEESAFVRRELDAFQDVLVRECTDAGIKAWRDNHYGFTVVVRGQKPTPDEPGTPDTFLHLRFSDGNLYVWLMPTAP